MRMLQVSAPPVCVFGFFRGMDSGILRWKCFRNTYINIPALLVPLFLFSLGMYQNKSLDLSRMIPVAVEVL